MKISTRHASHPDDVKHYDTQKLRDHFLLERIFEPDQIIGVYSTFDRLLVGGISPQRQSLTLETVPQLKSAYFLERRELGIINVGAPSRISVEGEDFLLNKKEALYIGKGSREVIFHPSEAGETLLYFNSAPAHQAYPTKKVGVDEAEKVEMGS